MIELMRRALENRAIKQSVEQDAQKGVQLYWEIVRHRIAERYGDLAALLPRTAPEMLRQNQEQMILRIWPISPIMAIDCSFVIDSEQVEITYCKVIQTYPGSNRVLHSTHSIEEALLFVHDSDQAMMVTALNEFYKRSDNV